MSQPSLTVKAIIWNMDHGDWNVTVQPNVDHLIIFNDLPRNTPLLLLLTYYLMPLIVALELQSMWCMGRNSFSTFCQWVNNTAQTERIPCLWHTLTVAKTNIECTPCLWSPPVKQPKMEWQSQGGWCAVMLLFISYLATIFNWLVWRSKEDLSLAEEKDNLLWRWIKLTGECTGYNSILSKQFLLLRFQKDRVHLPFCDNVLVCWPLLAPRETCKSHFCLHAFVNINCNDEEN